MKKKPDKLTVFATVIAVYDVLATSVNLFKQRLPVKPNDLNFVISFIYLSINQTKSTNYFRGLKIIIRSQDLKCLKSDKKFSYFSDQDGVRHDSAFFRRHRSLAVNSDLRTILTLFQHYKTIQKH